MTAQLILPETHHVTGGEIDPATFSSIHGARSPRVWWWPVDGPPPDVLVWPSDPGFDDEAGYFPQSHRPTAMDDPALARLLALTEPCEGGIGIGCGWPDAGDGCDEPDCHNGKRIVQLVQTCTECGGDGIDGSHDAALYYAYSGEISNCSTCEERQDGALPVARVTITLLPVKDRPSGPQPGDGPMIYHFGPCWWLWRADGDYESIVLPFKVEPGQWVVKAIEVTGTD